MQKKIWKVYYEDGKVLSTRKIPIGRMPRQGVQGIIEFVLEDERIVYYGSDFYIYKDGKISTMNLLEHEGLVPPPYGIPKEGVIFNSTYMETRKWEKLRLKIVADWNIYG